MGIKLNNEKLNKIISQYPNTYEWMKAKARWEHMCLGAILYHYEDYIDKLIKEEDANR